LCEINYLLNIQCLLLMRGNSVRVSTCYTPGDILLDVTPLTAQDYSHILEIGTLSATPAASPPSPPIKKRKHQTSLAATHPGHSMPTPRSPLELLAEAADQLLTHAPANTTTADAAAAAAPLPSIDTFWSENRFHDDTTQVTYTTLPTAPIMSTYATDKMWPMLTPPPPPPPSPVPVPAFTELTSPYSSLPPVVTGAAATAAAAASSQSTMTQNPVYTELSNFLQQIWPATPEEEKKSETQALAKAEILSLGESAGSLSLKTLTKRIDRLQYAVADIVRKINQPPPVSEG
jgi:hypothetical protein